MRNPTVLSILLAFFPFAVVATPIELDEAPASETQWGYRPADGATSETNPPNFSWRPQGDIVTWELECSRESDFKKVEYRAADIEFNVHTPTQALSGKRYL